MKSLDAYIPMDWRQALAEGKTLPECTVGAALSIRILGFTPLAQALEKELDLNAAQKRWSASSFGLATP